MRLAEFLESPAAEGAGLGPGSPGSVLRALVEAERAGFIRLRWDERRNIEVEEEGNHALCSPSSCP